jgi:hypothetical protein
LVATGRPIQAIPLLEAALRGPIDGEALYLTRTRLHLLLGDALGAAGQADAAAAHYRLVERAWRDGDREVALGRERARAWLAGHGRPLAN